LSVNGLALLDEFTAMTAEASRLVQEATAGRLSIDELRTAVDRLLARHQIASGRTVEFGRAADQVEAVEADPEAAGQSLAARYPTLGLTEEGRTVDDYFEDATQD
jgi:hypothetical protein